MAEEESLFLVCHNYGMGALWWWVRARSAEEIVENLAEVEVITDPAVIDRVQTWDLETVDLTADVAGLADLRAQRTAQRDQPGFAALAGRQVLYLRYEDDDADEKFDEQYLLELGPDGRRLRQVVIPTRRLRNRRRTRRLDLQPAVRRVQPEAGCHGDLQQRFKAAWSKAQNTNGAAP